MNRDAREFIEHNPILMLANVGLDGLPKIRPMITLGIFKDTLWFAVTESKLVYKELIKDNNLELCSVTLSRWIRITGKAVFENDKQTITHILENSDIMDKFYKRKNEKEEDVRIFYIQIEHGELSDFEQDMRIEF
ncbi:MAG: pyridoxamine 5'-phosphate oxidase family protein [Mucispirillum sp.]|uniref:Pyridoxamine 5'-phosphate oxidase family protein n=1 Tax=Candidatus Mucispirillum faecigallinarum TaxID=2838699 RepID=A0A9D2GTJ2_9BACT|nr:pyridoxamine 5'-phosphate oxidase family protein [Mucispirillum sp.]HIZ88884.1 pyridoxamine 5'-phosphate oxidase family protein [Candidatus Mucispirillum faecigallinarum]